MESQKKGFTLIELLIVIGILAILATTVVLVLNPAQLFAQARDSRRVEDMSSLRSALNFYLTNVSGPLLAPGTGTDICGTNYWGTIAGATENFVGAGMTQSSQVAMTVAGAGWIPVDLTDISGGSPLSVLPSDPINPDTTTQSYTYQCDATALTFEVNANLESVRYTTAPDNLEDSDGGDVSTIYEVGNDPGLNL